MVPYRYGTGTVLTLIYVLRWIPGLAELVKGHTEAGLRSIKTVLDSLEEQQRADPGTGTVHTHSR